MAKIEERQPDNVVQACIEDLIAASERAKPGRGGTSRRLRLMPKAMQQAVADLLLELLERRRQPEYPACAWCGPVCYGGACHNARVESNARWTDQFRAADSVTVGPTTYMLSDDDYGHEFARTLPPGATVEFYPPAAMREISNAAVDLRGRVPA